MAAGPASAGPVPLGSALGGINKMIALDQLRWAHSTETAGAYQKLVNAPGAKKNIVVVSVVFSSDVADQFTLRDAAAAGNVIGLKLFHASVDVRQLWVYWPLGANLSLYYDPIGANTVNVSVGYVINTES